MTLLHAASHRTFSLERNQLLFIVFSPLLSLRWDMSWRTIHLSRLSCIPYQLGYWNNSLICSFQSYVTCATCLNESWYCFSSAEETKLWSRQSCFISPHLQPVIYFQDCWLTGGQAAYLSPFHKQSSSHRQSAYRPLHSTGRVNNKKSIPLQSHADKSSTI